MNGKKRTAFIRGMCIFLAALMLIGVVYVGIASCSV